MEITLDLLQLILQLRGTEPHRPVGTPLAGALQRGLRPGFQLRHALAVAVRGAGEDVGHRRQGLGGIAALT